MAGYNNKYGVYKGQENPVVKHEKYLIAMEKQNKFLRKINMKDKMQEKREKLEAGFSLYVNGANAVSTGTKQQAMKTPRTFRAKTAEPDALASLPPMEDIVGKEYTRSNTAPEKRRKFWGQRSVHILDETGTKLELERYDQDYSEDFEDVDASVAFELNSLGSLDDSIKEEIGDQSGMDQNLEVAKFNDSISSAEVIAEEIINMSFDGTNDSISVLGEAKACLDKHPLNETFLVEKTTLGDKINKNKPEKSGVERNCSPVVQVEKQCLKVEDKTRTKTPKPEDAKNSSPKRSQISSRGETAKRNWLEESWNSLDRFNHSHLGRIQNMGQELEEILESMSIEQEEDLEDTNTDEFDSNDDGFEIPLLPGGKELVINIHSTWGDKHYVGLNGIEVFSKDGNLAKVSKITAEPPDINILPGYHNDPRTFSNLVNGVNQTCDDINMWLAPYTAGASHLVRLTFQEFTQIAAIRIWNYNKSRIHSHRGARDLTIALDDNVIFCGEIKKASGVATGGMDSFGDNILFTVDDNILEKIAENDSSFPDDAHMLQVGDFTRQVTKRPTTGDKVVDVKRDRPFTSTVRQSVNSVVVDRTGTYCAKCLKLRILSNWGGSFIGLVGIQVLGEENELIPLDLHSVQLLACEYLGSGDTCSVNRILNGNNITMDEMHMWRIPFNGQPCVVSLTFVQAVQITGFRVWNYNASFEDTYSGIKEVMVELDGQAFTRNSFVLRRAPGHVHFDFAQDVLFDTEKPKTNTKPSVKQEHSQTGTSRSRSDSYETPNAPTGFVYKFELLDTWGDLYYVGLNGIELYDEHGQLIKLTENEIAAFPSSVNILDQTLDDVRTPDKLINGVNDTMDGRNMWLSPVLPNQVNFIYIVFDFPVTVSKIKIWNYSKTASRGVKTIAILVDDLLIYSGFLQPCNPRAKHIQPHTVQFNDHEATDTSTQAPDLHQDIQFTNNNRVISAKHRKTVDQDLRPMTAMRPSQKIFKARF
ncbi:katanin-interacting protein-like [Ciona intestinalis]